MAFSRITLAISDQCPGGLDGFAPLSDDLPESVFVAAIEDGQDMDTSGKRHCIILDLMTDEHTRVDEKLISLDQAAAILGVSAADLVPLGRQRLAQIDDEANAYLQRKLSRRAANLQ